MHLLICFLEKHRFLVNAYDSQFVPCKDLLSCDPTQTLRKPFLLQNAIGNLIFLQLHCFFFIPLHCCLFKSFIYVQNPSLHRSRLSKETTKIHDFINIKHIHYCKLLIRLSIALRLSLASLKGSILLNKKCRVKLLSFSLWDFLLFVWAMSATTSTASLPFPQKFFGKDCISSERINITTLANHNCMLMSKIYLLFILGQFITQQFC